MAARLAPEVLEDDIAVSLARVMAAANKRARELSVDVDQSLITITQLALNGGVLWRINYGSKDYVGRRGGDVSIEVDPNDATITRVLRGQ
ncbi:MAG: hypothetical protein M5U01_00045 [Ardenticatenaceae bacterium]|nr:hypothetical protein [Ardenticatenaceae bacterium]